jgi:4-hydroxy-tetrahydrodipicolinate synthase
MFIDTNPIPVKKAVELMGMAGGPVRLPLDNLDEKKTTDLKKILATIPAAKKTAGAGSAGKREKTAVKSTRK